jgi:hypothetical protein
MRPFLFACLLLCALMSCRPAQDLYLYEVNEVSVNQSGVEKNNPKSDLEFISLAYADLLGQTISDQKLNRMVAAYTSLGDKELIADILIRNLLNQPAADLPTDTEMRADLEGFIRDTYKKFYVREPGQYELWYLRDLIEGDDSISPEMVYYAFLTSDEYRFF